MRVLILATVLVFSSVLLFTNLGGWGLWSPDEPRYAEVAREMVITGEYVLPHLNGRIYTRKPPLLFWMSALSYKIFGVKEWVARLPVALTGVAVILLTLFIGYRFFGFGVGVWSALILSTTFWFVWQARRVKMDVPLTLFIMISILAFYFGTRETEKGKKLLFYLLGFFAVGIGALCKGPVAFSIPGLTLGLYHIHMRDFRVLKEKEFWISLPLSFMIYFAWLIPAILKVGSGYALEQVYYRTSGLFLHTKVHKHGPLFYFYHYIIDAFPWSLFLIPAVWFGFSEYEDEERKAFTLLFWWFTANFIFFSLAATKRSAYLIPLYPAASVMIALYLERRNPVILFRICFVILAVIGAAIPIFFFFKLRLLFKPFLEAGLLILLLSTTPLLLSTKGFSRWKEWTVITLFLSLLFSFLFVIPASDRCKCVKKLCEKAVHISRAEGAPIYLYGIGNSHAGEFNFYTGVVPLTLVDKGDGNIKKLLEKREKVLLITKGRYFDHLERKYHFKPIFQQPCGHRFTLFSNKDFEEEKK